MKIRQAMKIGTKSGPGASAMGSEPVECWTRVRRFLSPSGQTRMVLRVQAIPRLGVFLVWALLLAMGVFGLIYLGAGFTGLFTDLLLLIVAFVCSLMAFRPLISNAVTRSTIAWTQTLSNVSMALATTGFMTVISVISSNGLGWGVPLTTGFSGFLGQGCSPWSLTVNPGIEACWDFTQKPVPVHWWALALHIFMVQVVFVLVGQILGELVSRLGRGGRCMLLVGLLIAIVFWHSVSGWHQEGWQQTVIQMLNLTRGHWMVRAVGSHFSMDDLWGYVTIYLIWPQAVFTLVLSVACVLASHRLINRRQLPTMQGITLLDLI